MVKRNKENPFMQSFREFTCAKLLIIAGQKTSRIVVCPAQSANTNSVENWHE
jgi:hypothetical protein